MYSSYAVRRTIINKWMCFRKITVAQSKKLLQINAWLCTLPFRVNTICKGTIAHKIMAIIICIQSKNSALCHQTKSIKLFSRMVKMFAGISSDNYWQRKKLLNCCLLDGNIYAKLKIGSKGNWKYATAAKHKSIFERNF